MGSGIIEIVDSIVIQLFAAVTVKQQLVVVTADLAVSNGVESKCHTGNVSSIANRAKSIGFVI